MIKVIWQRKPVRHEADEESNTQQLLYTLLDFRVCTFKSACLLKETAKPCCQSPCMEDFRTSVYLCRGNDSGKAVGLGAEGHMWTIKIHPKVALNTHALKTTFISQRLNQTLLYYSYESYKMFSLKLILVHSNYIIHFEYFLGSRPKEHASTKCQGGQRVAHLHHHFQENVFVFNSSGEYRSTRWQWATDCL